jgi:hypothetical protein
LDGDISVSVWRKLFGSSLVERERVIRKESYLKQVRYQMRYYEIMAEKEPDSIMRNHYRRMRQMYESTLEAEEETV